MQRESFGQRRSTKGTRSVITQVWGLGKLAALFVMLVWAALMLGVPAVQAEEPGSPYFLVKSELEGTEQFPLESTSVSVDIVGPISDVTVRQRYRNRSSRVIEAEYVFPASTGAAVHDMVMKVGERTLQAVISKREEASERFAKAREEGRTASLLEQHRPNVYQMSVTNIRPGESVEVELRYSEILRPEFEVYRFVYPTVVGPRFSKDEAEGVHKSWNANPYLQSGEAAPMDFSMRVNIRLALELSGLLSSHEIQVAYEDKRSALVTLAQSESRGADRDFVLQYRLGGGAIESGVLAYAGAEHDTFLLVLEPPHDVPPAAVVPREYLFVVDVSGSMEGFPLETGKVLARRLLSTMKAGDRFNVMLFAGGQEVLSPQSLPATPENIEAGVTFISSARGGGGTELHAALVRAFEMDREGGRSRSIVLITDGYVNFEPKLFELVQRSLGRGNLFPFGIGTSVNRYLIEGLARLGRSEPTVVLQAPDAAAAADRFVREISTPIMTDISLSFEGGTAIDVEPTVSPDLFASRPLTIVGKWKGGAAGSVTVSGTTSTGRFTRTVPIIPMPGAGGAVLEQLWARERLKRLSDFATSAKDSKLVEELTQLALRYKILSNYTSFVAVDTQRSQSSAVSIIRQPLPLPTNVSNSAVGSGGSGGGRYIIGGHGTTYNDVKVANATHAIMGYLEGSFSALGMLVCGSVAIVSLMIGAARKSRRASLVGLTFLVLAIAFFLLRAGISYFFNDIGIRQ